MVLSSQFMGQQILQVKLDEVYINLIQVSSHDAYEIGYPLSF